ncbi:very short patch repair endonuclease [Lignipirellula cremea]|uniref:Very short patch repair endonuclease n=1 Tax=Lignipirellula cremea TaxID=2528010 RepID=A0A518DLK3_9BACT|nr:DNA mismatch endonuclease Vsr [Lignipirellula cremea]QDU92719.1 Very short patch repair protein [Lignipirellula cremea]
MTDVFDAEKRSQIMRAVRGKDTAPELIVRRLVHALGYRFRLHRADLPGKPDLVFPGRRKVIFVHGCFWHQHACSRGARLPKSNREYWKAKLDRNRRRDRRHRDALRRLDWASLVVWECQLKKVAPLTARLIRFLEPSIPR